MSRSLMHKFLSNFSGITCYNIEDQRSPTFKIASIPEYMSYNRRGKDVYHFVNGGIEVEELTKLHSLFVDIDAGYADLDRKVYHSLYDVSIKKQAMLERINSLEKKPHYIVETRNGYHVYWLIDHPATRENIIKWSTIQSAICGYLGGDFNVLRPNQILRVPYTTWHKKWAEKDPFEVSIVLDNSDMEKYNMFTFINNTSLKNNVITEHKSFSIGTKNIQLQNFLPSSTMPATFTARLISLAKKAMAKAQQTMTNKAFSPNKAKTLP